MPLIALASVKASPGVTTTALVLAAMWPSPRRLLIEADPSGGDLGNWLALPPGKGLAGLATAARRDHDPGLAWQYSQELPGGTHVVAAPAGAEQASACVATIVGASFLAPFASGREVGIVDCGRLDPGSSSLQVAAQAAITLVLVRPCVSELTHLAQRIPELTRSGRLGLVLTPAGRRSAIEAAYPAEEIAATLNVAVRAVVPPDSRAVEHLIRSRGDVSKARRLPLLRVAARLAAELTPSGSHRAGGLPAALNHHHQPEVTAGDRH